MAAAWAGEPHWASRMHQDCVRFIRLPDQLIQQRIKHRFIPFLLWNWLTSPPSARERHKEPTQARPLTAERARAHARTLCQKEPRRRSQLQPGHCGKLHLFFHVSWNDVWRFLCSPAHHHHHHQCTYTVQDTHQSTEDMASVFHFPPQSKAKVWAWTAIPTFPRRHPVPLQIRHDKHLTQELDLSLHPWTEFQTSHWFCTPPGPDLLLLVSSWTKTRRSLSGPGEAGGEGGLVLD